MEHTIILIDIVHPAHVHFYRPLAEMLRRDGLSVTVVARSKDVTTGLLDAFEIPYIIPAATRSRGTSISAALELVQRAHTLSAYIRETNVGVVLTRNPSGVIAALGTSAISVFDTDDGRSAGLHYWLARPFADVITTSDLDPESHGRRHRRYRGLKAHMYLHESYFRPNRGIREQFGIHAEHLTVVRFSAYTAAHDWNAKGLGASVRDEILQRVKAQGMILLSIEDHDLRLIGRDHPSPGTRVAPEQFHDFLAAADLYIGDSQSVAAEAAILSVPTLHLSSFANRLFYLRYLEHRGIIRSFLPGEEELLLQALDFHFLGAVRRKPNLAHHYSPDDIVTWHRDLILEIVAQPSHYQGGQGFDG